MENPSLPGVTNWNLILCERGATPVGKRRTRLQAGKAMPRKWPDSFRHWVGRKRYNSREQYPRPEISLSNLVPVVSTSVTRRLHQRLLRSQAFLDAHGVVVYVTFGSRVPPLPSVVRAVGEGLVAGGWAVAWSLKEVEASHLPRGELVSYEVWVLGGGWVGGGFRPGGDFGGIAAQRARRTSGRAERIHALFEMVNRRRPPGMPPLCRVQAPHG